jgi:putative NADH-flavin reductase
MKLTIFGATGGIGREVVRQALDAGHAVTAVARRPAAITLQHERLCVLPGDVLDAASIAPALKGQDAVISSIGIAKDEPTELYSAGIRNIIAGMQEGGVRRLLCISATGIDPGPLWQRVIAKPLLWRFFGHSYADLVRMEAVVRESGLDWTIVRPPRLSDKPRTGHYEVAINRHLRRCNIISRADVADYLVNHIDDSASNCGVVEVAY